MNKNINFRRAVAILTLIILLAGLHLFIYAQNINLKYELTDIKVKLSEINSRIRSLGGQAAREEDLGEIERTARGKLGMVYPEDITYIVGSTVAVPKPNLPSPPSAKRD